MQFVLGSNRDRCFSTTTSEIVEYVDENGIPGYLDVCGSPTAEPDADQAVEGEKQVFTVQGISFGKFRKESGKKSQPETVKIQRAQKKYNRYFQYHNGKIIVPEGLPAFYTPPPEITDADVISIAQDTP